MDYFGEYNKNNKQITITFRRPNQRENSMVPSLLELYQVISNLNFSSKRIVIDSFDQILETIYVNSFKTRYFKNTLKMLDASAENDEIRLEHLLKELEGKTKTLLHPDNRYLINRWIETLKHYFPKINQNQFVDLYDITIDELTKDLENEFFQFLQKIGMLKKIRIILKITNDSSKSTIDALKIWIRADHLIPHFIITDENPYYDCPNSLNENNRIEDIESLLIK